LHVLPYQGNYKITNLPKSDEPVDEYEVVAMAKKLGITFEEMKQMSFVSLINILLSSVEEHEQKASQEDIDRMFG
jgi:hypothetical protein